MPEPTADVSVRLAWPADAEALGRTQVAAWQDSFRLELPAGVLAGLRVDAFADRWRESITRPDDARQRVLVALERIEVVGFAAVAPAADDDADPVRDGEVAELVVSPDRRGRGHGSRLLHAAVDTLRADGFGRATVWVNAAQDELRGFLTGQGWAADGAHRSLDLYGDGTVGVRQVRLHTGLTA